MYLSGVLRQGSALRSVTKECRNCLLRAPACRAVPRTAAAAARPVAPGGQLRSQQQRHVAVRATSVPDVYLEGVDPEVAAFQQHQKTAARPHPAEQAQTLMAASSFAVLSTLHSKDTAGGFPFGSVVQIASDGSGRPVFAASSLSQHTKDLLKDPRCCVTVLAGGWKGPQEARLTLVGNINVIKDDAERAQVRDTFLAKHPNSFWVDFGDFSWFRLDDVKTGTLVPGFGGGFTLSGTDYFAAQPDPVAPVSARVCKHMNEGHEDSIIAMVKHYVGLSVDKAAMRDIDRLGMNLLVTRQGQDLAIRLPFIRPVAEPNKVKEVLVEMSRAGKVPKTE